MQVAIAQPTFCPGLGYFEMIAESDKFCFLDDVQMSSQSWQQRNKFMINGKESWVGFPIQEKFLPLNQTRINQSTDWGYHALKKIESSYRDAPHYEEFMPYLHALFTASFYSVADLNMTGIILAANLLGILNDDHLVLSSSLNAKGKRSEHVINILNELGADTYLAFKGSTGYMKEDGWSWPGKVLVQDHGSSLSTWHYLMWLGLEATKALIPGKGFTDGII